jgi:hypothetical protein
MDSRIDFGMDGSVTIANVQKRHGGIYRCTATTGTSKLGSLNYLGYIPIPRF